LTKQRIDFNYVPPEHRAIDERLTNWGMWCKNPTSYGVCPMFRDTPPPPRVRAEIESRVIVDIEDAKDIQRRVIGLQQVSLRLVLGWFYTKDESPKRAAQRMGCDMHGLSAQLKTARQLLINNGA